MYILFLNINIKIIEAVLVLSLTCKQVLSKHVDIYKKRKVSIVCNF